MPTDKYDLHTIDYSVQGWDTILAADMEKLDDVIPSREIVTLGETVTAYQPLCFAAADSKWYKAQANGTLQPTHGLALEGGDEDDEVRIHRMGKITNAGWAWASLGAPVYLKDDVAGGLTQTPPAANKQIIGYAISATSILVVSLPHTITTAPIAEPAADDDFLVGENSPLGWVRKTLAQAKAILGIGAAFAAPTADNDLLFGDADPLGWVKKTLAQAKTILGIDAATDTASGVVELATAGEINTGTDAGRAVSPDALAGSNLGTKDIPIKVVGFGDACVAYDSVDLLLIPSSMNGMNLVDLVASVALPGITGSMMIALMRARPTMIGDATSQFDITDQGGNTFRYTWDGTGTDPGIDNTLASIQADDAAAINAQNFNAANNGNFVISAVGTNYFEVTNASGVAESNKTIGTGHIQIAKLRQMLTVPLFIDSLEFTSVTAATPFDIDESFDDIATGDYLVAMVTTVHTTPAQGLWVTPSFRLP
jgi:hypothetical protein